MAEATWRLRRHQGQLYKNQSRWNLNVCHRRFGKTVYEIVKLVTATLECPLNDPRFAYIAPFRNQAKSIAWDYLKAYSKQIPRAKPNEAELRVDYPNGGRISLYGSDKPDNIRGIYLDGCVMDEYAQIKPSLFGEVIRPLLTDRKGWADFTGTPKGRNHFWDLNNIALENEDGDWSHNIFRASETGIIDAKELASARKIMSEDQYMQEFECSWTAAVQGAYFAKEMAAIREKGQIGPVPYEPVAEVHTCWDLGLNDTTVIWFFQMIGKEVRFIDYYENNGEKLAHYAQVLKDKQVENGYLYGNHYLPHDVEVKELQTGRSREDALKSMGVSPIKKVKRINHKEDGIEMARQKIPTCWFDEKKCFDGVRALENYQKEWDDKRQVFKSTPLHNWASNPADAFMQFAQGVQPSKIWTPLNVEPDIV